MKIVPTNSIPQLGILSLKITCQVFLFKVSMLWVSIVTFHIIVKQKVMVTKFAVDIFTSDLKQAFGSHFDTTCQYHVVHAPCLPACLVVVQLTVKKRNGWSLFWI